MQCRNCGTELKEHAKFCAACGTRVADPVKSALPVFIHDVNKVWPEWQPVSILGRGSYGTVYQAIRKDNTLESHAAIKVISIPAHPTEVDTLRSEGLDESSARTYLYSIVTSFVDEIRMMEELKGLPNIVSVEDYKVLEKVGEIGWDIYIRMELLTPFRNYICDKNLTEAEVVKLGSDICTALEICGKRSIIHRDIKPENIFINDFGYFKLGDFGIARKMENDVNSFSQRGTYSYIAPEVISSTKYDARVDIYSLGLVLYRLLNHNRLPFLDTEKQLLNPNERSHAMARRIMGEPLPAPAEASPAMAQVILKACDPDPNQRFASATEFKKALADALNAPQTSERTTPVRKAPAAENPVVEKPVAAPVAEITTPVRKAKPEDKTTDDKTVSVRKIPTVPKKEQKPKREPKPKKEHTPKVKAPRKPFKFKKWIPAFIATAVIAVLIVLGFANNGFHTIDGKTYHLKMGTKDTGWQIINHYAYYFDENGVMQTGFQEIDGNTYYFHENGTKAYSMQEINGKTYYFDDNGVLIE